MAARSTRAQVGLTFQLCHHHGGQRTAREAVVGGEWSEVGGRRSGVENAFRDRIARHGAQFCREKPVSPSSAELTTHYPRRARPTTRGAGSLAAPGSSLDRTIALSLEGRTLGSRLSVAASAFHLPGGVAVPVSRLDLGPPNPYRSTQEIAG